MLFHATIEALKDKTLLVGVVYFDRSAAIGSRATSLLAHHFQAFMIGLCDASLLVSFFSMIEEIHLIQVK
jgi:hypothetical protein